MYKVKVTEIAIADCLSVVDANSFDASYAWPVYTTLGTVTMEVLLATIIWWLTPIDLKNPMPY